MEVRDLCKRLAFAHSQIIYRFYTIPEEYNVLKVRAGFFLYCLHLITSRHQSARREGRKQKLLKLVIFESQESHQDRPQGLNKTTYWTFKNLGRAAAQCNGIAACAYPLIKKHTYSTWVQYSTRSVVLRPLLAFFWTNGAQITLLFRVDWSKDLFSLLEKRPRMPCLVRSCECDSRRLLCAGALGGSAPASIVCGDVTNR